MDVLSKQRVDLISFKHKLKILWKENANTYFSLLKKYMQAKLSKKELDSAVRVLLVTDENSNSFLLH
jgi:hypothetical protein